MRSSFHALAALLVPLVTATVATTPRLPTHGLAGRATCNPPDQVCEDDCMESGATCCNDGTSSYCAAGSYCTTNSCCIVGYLCDEPPLNPDVAASLSTLPSYSWTWETFPTADPDSFFGGSIGSDSAGPTTYSFSFESQPTGLSNAGPGSGTTDGASKPTSLSSSPQPNAAGYMAACPGLVAGCAVAAAALLI
ncbi:hypothetical protein Micbo1qcDRAFT_10018 [Microdochium bolleyi]|uniref:GPI anchored protein n=1 Tax=Microdochium bolleyi TaxID=196109 RepID=A0A136IXH6_9PEZI|nr:hypothetical protein Micbo1qcDRAFT_10018 [Microdochium bolleyi]